MAPLRSARARDADRRDVYDAVRFRLAPAVCARHVVAIEDRKLRGRVRIGTWVQRTPRISALLVAACRCVLPLRFARKETTVPNAERPGLEPIDVVDRFVLAFGDDGRPRLIGT